MTMVGGPSLRTSRVKARVSSPARPMRPLSRIQLGKSVSARKLDGPVTASRTMQPSACGSAASTSSALAPTLPMCGKVKATTCLRVAGVGHHLLVSGHGGVEAQLADRLAFRPEPLPPGDPPVGEHQYARRPVRGLRRRSRQDRPSRGSLSAGFNDVAKPQPLGRCGLQVNAVKARKPRLHLVLSGERRRTGDDSRRHQGCAGDGDEGRRQGGDADAPPDPVGDQEPRHRAAHRGQRRPTTICWSPKCCRK